MSLKCQQMKLLHAVHHSGNTTLVGMYSMTVNEKLCS